MAGFFCSLMKKILIAILLICLLCLSACAEGNFPFHTRQLETTEPQVFRVYVCGAVAQEGYVEICEGADYFQLVCLAGYIPQTVTPSNPHLVVNGITSLIVRYFDGEKPCYCTNVNGQAVSERQEIENVSAQTVDKIATYLQTHGKITDKTQLQNILTPDEYQNNFYKFYVSETDFEKGS